MWIEYNPNPMGKRVGDCTVRAVSVATNQDWETAYTGLCIQGMQMADMPSNNAVVGAYLKRHGYQRGMLSNECPECYTIKDFCDEHPNGTFVVFTSGHVLTIKDGIAFDSWNSLKENPIFYYEKGDN